MPATDHAYKLARRFRRDLTLPELLLWRRLKEADIRFRRQHPLGPYILDFYCASARLAIEVDGASHDFGDRPGRDDARIAWLATKGIEVCRLAAPDVLRDADSIADAIIALCADRREPLHRTASLSGPPPHGFAAGRSEQ